MAVAAVAAAAAAMGRGGAAAAAAAAADVFGAATYARRRRQGGQKRQRPRRTMAPAAQASVLAGSERAGLRDGRQGPADGHKRRRITPRSAVVPPSDAFVASKRAHFAEIDDEPLDGGDDDSFGRAAGATFPSAAAPAAVVCAGAAAARAPTQAGPGGLKFHSMPAPATPSRPLAPPSGGDVTIGASSEAREEYAAYAAEVRALGMEPIAEMEFLSTLAATSRPCII